MSTPTTPEHPIDTYTSYLEYLEAYSRNDGEYAWLREILSVSIGGQRVNVSMTDYVEEGLAPYLSSNHEITDLDTLSRALSSRDPRVVTRVIHITYERPRSISKEVVNEIALQFKIGPDFLRKHFHSDNEYAILPEVGNFSLRKPRDTIQEMSSQHLTEHLGREFHFVDSSGLTKLSAYIHRESSTVLIWECSSAFVGFEFALKPLWPDYTRLPPTPRRLDPMKSFSVESTAYLTTWSIAIGNKDPLFFVYSSVFAMIKTFGVQYHRKFDPALYHSKYMSKNVLTGDQAMAEYGEFEIMTIQSALDNLQYEVEKLWYHSSVMETRCLFETMKSDIMYLSRRFERSAQYLRDKKGSALIVAQIDEARASTQAAVSVSSLSKLAFIFIPLSFTSSIFGMNVIEFGQGTVPLRNFLISAAVVGTCALILLSSSLWNTIIRSGLIDNTKIIFFLLLKSPKLAFWYIQLCVTFEHPVVMALCGSSVQETLGIRNVVGDHNERSRRDAYKYMRQSYSGMWPLKSWEERGDDICREIWELKNIEKESGLTKKKALFEGIELQQRTGI